MASLCAAVHRDIHKDLTSIVLSGPIDHGQAGAVYDLIDSCLDEGPDAVILDLRDVEELPHAVAQAIDAAAHQPRLGLPDIELFLTGSPGNDRVGPFTACLSIEDALAAVAGRQAGHEETQLPFDNTVSAPGEARQMVRQACQQWNLDHLAPDAALILSELVSNTIQHTGDGGVATASSRPGYLKLRVTDSDPRPLTPIGPTFPSNLAPGGRGLIMIDRIGSRWGYRIHHGGDAKVVWTTLPTS